MALCQVRPVELWAFTALDGHDEEDGTTNVMCRINSAPLNLSEACYALTNIGYDRNLTHAYGYQHNGYTGGWSSHGHSEKGCRAFLKCEANDLVIPPSYVKDEQIVSDPLGWVQAVINKYTQTNEET
jgi:hypothetical protein